MRLWHKDLIYVLPRQQLLGQWRECCLIAKNIAEKGTPNHLLVNRVLDYPLDHFYTYAQRVRDECEVRGYKCNFERFKTCSFWKRIIPQSDLFCEWHNERYLTQCFFNLQEKYDCGGITEDEYSRILVGFARSVGK